MKSIKSIESIKVAGACRKFFGVIEYAGRAQAMRPYQRISWGLLGLANAENLYFIKNLNIEFHYPGPSGAANLIGQGMSQDVMSIQSPRKSL
jgi:hypothetical protein